MQYRLSSDIQVIKEIIGYDNDNADFSPVFGGKLGIYHSLRSSFYLLNNEDWMVFDYFKGVESGKISIDIENNLEIQAIEEKSQLKNFAKIFQNFLDLDIIVDANKKFTISKDIKFSEAEIYIGATEGCNFACAGCATSVDLIPAEKARTLNLELLEKYLESFFRSCAEKNYSSAHIKWAGGEPLLEKSFKLIKESQKMIKSLAKKFKIKYHQTILTNGVYASQEKIDFAKNYRMHISLSLWGTAEYQDRLRRPRNNSQTYQHLVGRIKDLYHSGISFNINYVLTPQNSEDFPLFIETMWDINSPNFIGKDWEVKKTTCSWHKLF
jgi:sulfatase maturation enzyme AslB (radical SAM superfamily)